MGKNGPDEDATPRAGKIRPDRSKPGSSAAPTDRIVREFVRLLKSTNRSLRQMNREAAAMNAEMDRMIAETRRVLAETDELLARASTRETARVAP